jgi:hypothetical protein
MRQVRGCSAGIPLGEKARKVLRSSGSREDDVAEGLLRAAYALTAGARIQGCCTVADTGFTSQVCERPCARCNKAVLAVAREGTHPWLASCSSQQGAEKRSEQQALHRGWLAHACRVGWCSGTEVAFLCFRGTAQCCVCPGGGSENCVSTGPRCSKKHW